MFLSEFARSRANDATSFNLKSSFDIGRCELPTYLPTYLSLLRLYFAVGACFIFNHLVLARSLRKQMGWPRANSYCLAQALMHACESVSTQRSQLVRHSLNAISRRRRDSNIRHSINWTLILSRASERFLSLFFSRRYCLPSKKAEFLILKSTI